MRRTLATAAVAAIGTAVVVLPATAATAASGTATVSVLHAVPGLTVDVYANGSKLLSGFTPGTLTQPQQLPAGNYDLKVLKAGDPATAAPAIEASGVQVPAGANITVVAHLDASGKPELTPYVNDTSAVPAGQARLTVRHDAAAPAVDVRAGGKPVVTNLANPDQRSLTVPAGTVSADVVATGTTTPVIGPADLSLPAGTSTVVYAWGSLDQKNLQLATQRITGIGGAPGGVSAGTGGFVHDGAPLWVAAASGGALVVAAGAGLRAAAVRGRRDGDRAA